MMNGGGDDNDTQQKSAMSPLVTAQDRKRMILERRKKEREQQASENTGADDGMAAATTTAASRSAFGSLKRQRSDSSRLFPNDENITPKAGARSTLFGAVMQRTSSASTSASTPTKQRSISDSAPTALTPKSRVAWNSVSTPSSSRSKSFLSANSPCGFALLKVLESVASPFRHKEDDDQEADEHEESPDAAKIEEWQEGYLHSDSIGVVDWSIKRKLRLECHPASCLPRTCDLQDALSYWQHPAMYPLPTFEGDENDQTTREVSATMMPSSLNISDMVRGRDALLHRLCRHDPTTWKQRRNREWQEAFRSLYFKWIQQVESQQTALETGEDVSPKTVTQTYFYAMGPGRTILFRIGVDQTADDGKPQIVPLIVLSSTTLQMRSKLRSMGAKLVYYHDRSMEFGESVLERNKPKKVTEDETEAVHEELEALRRAQARGETAGADVSIATKTKSTTRSPRSVPPLCLVGEDDSAAFFEFYLNTLGGRGSTWIKGNGDVPLLLSRKVGPFMHASMQSLVVSSRREARGSQDNSAAQDHHHAAIELRGPILPCALKEIVCSATTLMMKNTEVKDQSSNRHGDDVGSHYYVVQTQAHDGEEGTNLDSAATGTAGSRWLNEGSDIYEKLASNGEKPSGCEQGEVVSMIVWDIARPNMIAYKTEPRLN